MRYMAMVATRKRSSADICAWRAGGALGTTRDAVKTPLNPRVVARCSRPRPPVELAYLAEQSAAMLLVSQKIISTPGGWKHARAGGRGRARGWGSRVLTGEVGARGTSVRRAAESVAGSQLQLPCVGKAMWAWSVGQGCRVKSKANNPINKNFKV
jgi:hypothetical protein